MRIKLDLKINVFDSKANIKFDSKNIHDVFYQKIHCKTIQKTEILTPKINFNFGLWKIDKMSKKSEFCNTNFVCETQYLIPEKGPFS